jgi:hypothetical protein
VGPPPVLALRFSVTAFLNVHCLSTIFLATFSITRYSLFIMFTLCFSVLASMLELTLFFTAIGEL